MSENNQRPEVGVAHVVLHTDRMQESAKFMRIIGMRPIFDGPEVSVYEMRGGTHLILMLKDKVLAGDASFDLMVDDLHATHRRLTSLGLAPSPIEARPVIDHEVFTVREPAGCHYILLKPRFGQAHMKRNLVLKHVFQSNATLHARRIHV